MKTPSFLRSRALTVVLALLAGWLLRGLLVSDAPDGAAHADHADGAEPSADEEQAPTIWTCSMDPQVQSPTPGLCPICGMDLIPLVGDREQLAPRQLRLSPTALALADVRTVAVERRAIGRELRLAGRVEADQTRETVVSNWMPGTLSRLFVNAAGVTVREGDHLAELYHPDLRVAEQELLDAVAARDELGANPNEGRAAISGARITAARQALLDLGLSEAEIDGVVAAGVAKERLTLHAPAAGVVTVKTVVEGDFVKPGTHLYTLSDLAKVWLVVDAYESDLAWLRFGQEVRFEVLAYPGRTFRGRIAIIEPSLDPRTRTARVRINVENPGQDLLPGMFARATVTATLSGGGRPVDPALAGKAMCPMHPEVIGEAGAPCPDCGMDLVPVEELGLAVAGTSEPPLLIPASAALITGRRAVVYVRLPAEEDKDPLFEGRVVTLGPRAGDAWVVLEGLAEGEQVVVSGAFTIDAELQLKAKTSMMSAAGPEEVDDGIDVPAELREALGGIVERGVALSTALALDDLAAAQAEAARLQELCAGVDLALLGLEDGRRAAELLDAVAAQAAAVGGADDLAESRVVFEHLQHALLALTRTLGYRTADARTVSVFHCPMAFDNRGADWLQWSGTRTENPYFGSGMYRCGKEQQVVPTGEDE